MKTNPAMTGHMTTMATLDRPIRRLLLDCAYTGKRNRIGSIMTGGK